MNIILKNSIKTHNKKINSEKNSGPYYFLNIIFSNLTSNKRFKTSLNSLLYLNWR